MLTHLILLPVLYFVFTEPDRLRVDAEPAVAVLTIQEPGRNLVQLPELEFRLSIAPYCARRGQPESLSITIADTRKTLRGEDLLAENDVEVSMRVAASQLAPFALREFCIDPAAEGQSLLIRSAMAAHASLRCARGEERTVVFTAEELDIRMDCVRSVTAADAVGD